MSNRSKKRKAEVFNKVSKLTEHFMVSSSNFYQQHLQTDTTRWQQALTGSGQNEQSTSSNAVGLNEDITRYEGDNDDDGNNVADDGNNVADDDDNNDDDDGNNVADDDDNNDDDDGNNEVDDANNNLSGICMDSLSDYNGRDIYIMLLLLQARHELTNAAVSDTAKLLNLIGKKCLTSYQMIFKEAKLFTPIIYKYFYTKCLCGITNPIVDLNQRVSCNCGQSNILPKEAIKKDSYFCYVSLREWLTYLIPRFFDQLKLNHKPNSNSLHDVLDGSEYQRLIGRGIQMNKPGALNLTITLGYDGVQFNNNKSMWPVVCYLNELPFNLRQELSLLVGLHAKASKPPKSILRPLIDELVEYDREPIEIVLMDGRVFLFHVRLLLVIADAPARADILNCKQFNGIHGCNMCLIETQYVTEQHCRRYPMDVNYVSRDNSEWRRLSSLAQDNSYDEDIHMGILGKSELSRLDYIHLNVISPPEYLHSQLIGSVRLIVNAWLGKIKGVPQILSDGDIMTIDSRLETILFPAQQLKRMLTFAQIDNWKAMDYENFLFYGFLTLENVLPSKYFLNFKKLSIIISSLCKSSISDLQRLEEMVKEFIHDFGKIYSNYMHRFNVHCILHLPTVVRLFGPLTTSSAFIVENSMGVYSRKVKTGTFVAEQVFNKSTVMSSIKSIIRSSNNENLSSKILNFAKNSFGCSSSGIIVTNKIDTQLNNMEIKALNEYDSCFLKEKFDLYSRVKFDDIVVTSRCHGNSATISNSFVKTSKGFYKICKICKTTSRTIMIGVRYEEVDDPAIQDHYYIKKANPMGINMEVVEIPSVIAVCTIYCSANNLYIMELVNRHL